MEKNAEKRIDTPPSAASASSERIYTAAQPSGDAIAAFSFNPEPLSAPIEAHARKAEEKLGFIPNVVKMYSFSMPKAEAFFGLVNEIMRGPSGLSELEREMIAVVVSSHNRCFYCITAHGAAFRLLSGNPALAETLVMNFRVANLPDRHRAMLEFSIKMTEAPWSICNGDRMRLVEVGFSERDIWDIAAVASFFNMSNRMASAMDLRPNDEYHALAR